MKSLLNVSPNDMKLKQFLLLLKHTLIRVTVIFGQLIREI